MLHRRDFIRCGSLILAIAGAGCGGGGGSSGKGLVLSGSVQSPGGMALALGGPGLAGLSPVPDGTSVELVRLDPLGNETATVARTTTSAGRYAFNLGQLHLGFANDLAVAAGSGATRMRALATSATVDVDPVSEATLRVILQQNVGLEPFTLKETDDLAVAVRLFATTESLQSQPDIAASVDLVVDAVLADPDLSAFVTAAAEVGQSNAGPGDVGDYFPATIGDAWRLDGSETIDGGAPQPYVNAMRVASIDGAGVQTVEWSTPPAASVAAHDYAEETSAALINRGNDDATDFLTRSVAPYDEVHFPLRAGDVRTLFSVAYAPLGEDLDYDGYEDAVSASASRRTAGFEEVTVPAGTFENCVRFETTAYFTLFLSSGYRVTGAQTQTDWFAPHRGLVSSQGSITTSAFGSTSRDDYHEELGAWQVGDAGKGILAPQILAYDVAYPSSDETRPGRPAVAFDGTNYLVVTGNDATNPAHLSGTLLTATGVVMKQFDLLFVGGEARFRPAAAFDGTNYLVVFNPAIPGASDNAITGVRVSKDGEVLDPAGFEISTNGGSNYEPDIAFDGTNYLVTWRRFNNVTYGDIRGALVTPAGTVLQRFTVNAAAGDQSFPQIVFGGGNYLVVWQDQPIGDHSHVRGARVAPDGTVLDPDGFDVAMGSNDDLEPGVAFDGGRYVVTWVDIDSTTDAHSLLARRIELDGTMTDAAPLPICSTDVPYQNPTVVFDGANYLLAWEVDFSYASPGADGIWSKRLTPAGELLDGASDSPGVLVAQREPVYDELVDPRLAQGFANALLVWTANSEQVGQGKDIAGSIVYPR